MSDWREPVTPERRSYKRVPPLGNKLKEFAFLLERVRHGNTQYDSCPCCERLAEQLLPELKLIFNFRT